MDYNVANRPAFHLMSPHHIAPAPSAASVAQSLMARLDELSYNELSHLASAIEVEQVNRMAAHAGHHNEYEMTW